MKATITILALLGALVAVAANAQEPEVFYMGEPTNTCVTLSDGSGWCPPPREADVRCLEQTTFGWSTVPCDGIDYPPEPYIEERKILPHGAPGAQGDLMQAPDGDGLIILE